MYKCNVHKLKDTCVGVSTNKHLIHKLQQGGRASYRGAGGDAPGGEVSLESHGNYKITLITI